jgi:hypothetical protein
MRAGAEADAARGDPASGAKRWSEGDVGDPRHLAPPHRGISYLKMLAEMHAALKPRCYLEIGSRWGDSLKLSRSPTIAIDPAFQLPEMFAAERPHLRLFEMTSDRFFSDHSPTAILGEDVSFAFLDGMHRFEFLLRDFMNTERFCARSSVIALHDCVPVSSAMVAREQDAPRADEFDVLPGAWAGDVWKLLPILRQYRPDLHVTVFDCPPTGLAFVSNLDPTSQVLQDHYDQIVETYMGLSIATLGVAEFARSLNVQRSWRSVQGGELATLVAPARREAAR